MKFTKIFAVICILVVIVTIVLIVSTNTVHAQGQLPPSMSGTLQQPIPFDTFGNFPHPLDGTNQWMIYCPAVK